MKLAFYKKIEKKEDEVSLLEQILAEYFKFSRMAPAMGLMSCPNSQHGHISPWL